MEVATVVGGALLSASFEKLFDLLISPQLRQFVSKTEVESQLHKWEVMLPMIHAVLDDAQDKETTSRVVQIWLSELRDLVYDVEDVLDEFATEALRLKLKEAASSGRKVSKFLPSFGSSHLKFISGMGTKLKDITGRMETICTHKSNLDLGERAMGGGRGRPEVTTARTPTTSLPDTHFFGRDSDKKAILDMLLADGADVVSVIPIQGMGGLGKTTLAQQLYNDDSVKLRFDLRAWVCVSDTFDILAMTKTILRSVDGGTCDGRTLDEVQVSLEKMLSDKKFFIVLDDVWNEKYEDWTILYKPLRRGAPGSKVIVTTRNRQVAEMTGNTQAYRLGALSYEDCLSLFSQHALGVNNFDGHADLKDIGEKIVEKCKGLPLAAKTLGGLLRTKLQHDEWVDILESEIWQLPKEKSDILPALRLSYHHLPSQLKQCFAYCALFPKDYEFDMDELVLLWMAEGFLSHPKRRKGLKDVGAQYFNALLSRSFFQPSNSDCARFVMHDLIHDVAQVVAGDIFFHLDDGVEAHKHLPTLRTRHSSFIRQYGDTLGRFKAFEEGKGLRTFLALPVHGSHANKFASVDLLDMVLSKLRKLRVFSVSGYKIREVPMLVNGLKHLRYLNLSATLIKLLPDFVCSLLNLQTLLLTSCSELEKLPSRIGNLLDLSLLDVRKTRKLKEMPAGIGNLTELQSLGKFIVGLARVDGLNIRELKNLSKLKEELSLEELQNVEKSQDARDANLKGKEGLKQLAMRWNRNSDDIISNGSIAAEVLESLQPHRNMETLAIEFYCGLKFPSWFEDPILMSNVVKIELTNCWKSTSLPCFGRLPMLKHLTIKGMKEIKSLGNGFYGSESGGFLSLETLKLQDMQGLEKWCLCDIDAAVRECVPKLPNLLELEILKCPVLVGECLVSLPSLRKLKLEECNESVLRCVIDMNSLTTLNIRNMMGLSCLHESAGQLLVGLEDLNIDNCKDLLSICQSEHQIEDNMTCLQSLKVRSCDDLVSFFTAQTMKKMTSLEMLTVKDCPRICSAQFTQQEEEERNDEGKSPWRLKHIELSNCGDQLVECVVSRVLLGADRCALVDHLRITSCDSLHHLAIKSKRGGSEVRDMMIKDCINLVSISNYYEEKRSIVEIETLRIENCPSLTTDGMKLLFAVKKFELEGCSQLESIAEESIILFNENHSIPWTVVEDIAIRDCPNLKRLPDKLHQLTYLTSLVLSNCDGLELFPENGLPVPNLRTFEIKGCKNLKSGPKNMQNLTSLKELVVQDVKSFPGEGGLPPNLIELDLTGCPDVKHQMFEPLTSLEELTIGEDMSIKGMLLPTTLKSLYLWSMKKLECISSSSSPSPSSKCLHLHKDLTSLAYLYIVECPKLRYLPKEGLPPTLEQLYIIRCPILQSKCVKGKGKYWPRISLIPRILC